MIFFFYLFSHSRIEFLDGFRQKAFTHSTGRYGHSEEGLVGVQTPAPQQFLIRLVYLLELFRFGPKVIRLLFTQQSLVQNLLRWCQMKSLIILSKCILILIREKIMVFDVILLLKRVSSNLRGYIKISYLLKNIFQKFYTIFTILVLFI